MKKLVDHEQCVSRENMFCNAGIKVRLSYTLTIGCMIATDDFTGTINHTFIFKTNLSNQSESAY